MRISDWSSDVCSSDLAQAVCPARAGADRGRDGHADALAGSAHGSHRLDSGWQQCAHFPPARHGPRIAQSGHDGRSEEHTSELQSLMRISYAVFCLKKKIHNTNDSSNTI